MINLSKSGDTSVFEFVNNGPYLENGTIEVPVNSLSLVIDSSNMATFKKASSNDVFIAATYDELGMTKAELETFYKENMAGSTGGGGDITSGEVQTMIDESISGKADSSAVTESINAAVSGKADISDIPDVSNYFDGAEYDSGTTRINFYHGNTVKAYIDASAFIVDGMIDDVRIDTISGVTYLVIDFNTASGKEDIQIPITDIFDASNYYSKSEIDSIESGLKNSIDEKLDASAYTPTDLSEYWTSAQTETAISNATSGKADTSAVTESINAAVSGKVDTSAITSSVTSASTNTEMPTAKAVYDSISGKQDTILGLWSESPKRSVSIGYSNDNSVNCNSSLAVGSSNTIGSGTRASIAVGEHNTVGGYLTTYGMYVFGGYCNATNNYSLANGYYVNTDNLYEAGFGTYNKTTYDYTKPFGDSGNTLFSVGNGTANNARHNAFEIKQNGDIYITKDGQDIKLQDHLGGGGGKAIEAGRGISITTGESADTVSFNLPISAGTGPSSIIEGSIGNKASGNQSHAEGFSTSATSQGSHSEGIYSKASNTAAHSEGNNTTASGSYSHSEGGNTTASGSYSHSEGGNTTASGSYSHAEGDNTTASGTCSHSEGYWTTASGSYSHSEGYFAKASGTCSHAEGEQVNARNECEHSQGRYNVSNLASPTFGNSGNTLFSVGNGTADDARHNAFEIRQNGDIYVTSGGTDIKLQDYLGDTVSSAITSGDTNAVAGGVLYDELRYTTTISATTLEWENNDGGSTTNYPVGTSKLEFIVDESLMTDGYFSFVSNAEQGDVGSLNISSSDGTITVSDEWGVSYSISGNVVTVTYPAIASTVDYINSAYDCYWTVIAIGETESIIPVIDQVSANTASISQIDNKLDEVNEKFGGLKLVKLTQAQYDALAPNYDNNTLYVIKD